jgi:hypothetical protein
MVSMWPINTSGARHIPNMVASHLWMTEVK